MLWNHAMIQGMVSDSLVLLLNTPAESVEAVQGVMPPVLLQGCSWASIDHVVS